MAVNLVHVVKRPNTSVNWRLHNGFSPDLYKNYDNLNFNIEISDDQLTETTTYTFDDEQGFLDWVLVHLNDDDEKQYRLENYNYQEQNNMERKYYLK